MADEMDLTDFPGFLGNDLFSTCANSNCTTDQTMPTIVELQQLMKKFPPRQPEVILLLEVHRAELLRKCSPPMQPEAFPFSALNGIPVEFYATIEELNYATSEHIEAGRKVIRIDN
jgi:hypothetical protein